jgi:site-specific DNA recombinase
MNGEPKNCRCAIYTRKSSEEGLDQSFNSLDAQREACENFIASQRQENWRLLQIRYDDGGYSGGNLERPALKRLLEEVEKGKVDTIVVYKVDRLTRSLADFAKIVELLDAGGASFVSVTQQFNTTTSMGRLTLNVLLSFAQFEREVTGERIRDKIAASKRKGMWMGGTVPLGYDLRDRKLVVNPKEAALVCNLYRLYLELGCVSQLKAHLDREGITSKVRISTSGNRTGGASYSRGALYEILRNRHYLGEITHRQQHYPGEHDAIVPRELWDRVQIQLGGDNQGRKTGLKANSSSMLVGLLRDAKGNKFTPSHTLKTGKRYRYYVCPPAAGHDSSASSRAPIRVPAHEIERLVLSRLQQFLQCEKAVADELTPPDESPAATQELLAAARKLCIEWPSMSPIAVHELVRKAVKRVTIDQGRVELLVSKSGIRALLLANQSSALQFSGDDLRLVFETELKRYASEVRLVIPPGSEGQTAARPVPSLLKAIVRAHDWCEKLVTGKVSDVRALANQTGLNERYVSRILECAFLAPDIVEAILAGRQPSDLTVRKLWNKLPLDWAEQRKQLGFATPS